MLNVAKESYLNVIDKFFKQNLQFIKKYPAI